MTVKFFVLYLHLVAAMFWIGEMLTLMLILTPVVYRQGDTAKRAQLYHEVGMQSRPWMLGALALLVATGVGNLYFLNVPWKTLFDLGFYRTPLGRTLGWKLLGVLGILLLTVLHDVAMARLRARGGTVTRGSYRALGRWVGRLNLLLGLLVSWLGLRLMFGG
ncbi:MAG: hypothetical protein KM312_12720 [Hydrogenibacillus schlegelii]|uniref:Copper resistance protein D domain-containing protein n=1 Tax=Hydrogenibacillus schlegelii TaxID=1484 RepID=A0A947GAG4_HYDSH|nr:hypothetical protein [Hydrogenibacillus schlegelii]